jgi:arginine decarboxylase
LKILRSQPRQDSPLNEFVPNAIFLTKGVGRSRERLSSFEEALRDAGIAQYNLVAVSSIFPPKCKLISRSQGEKYLRPGQIVYCVMARSDTNEYHRLIAASIGIAIPRNPEHYGYLSEHHCSGMTQKAAGDYAEDLAAQMLASTLGVPFDLDKAYDARKQQYRLGGEIVTTREITQTAEGNKNGLWTTVLAAAVMVRMT